MMSEADVRARMAERFGEAAVQRLDTYVDLLVAENERQNLVAPSTIRIVWYRHVLDSSQLLDHAPAEWHTWIDIGSGAGLPGLVIAALFPDRHVMMVEPRPRRVAFLREAAGVIALNNAVVVQARAEAVRPPSADVISARAVASVDKLLIMSRAFTSLSTTFILPRGQSGLVEIEQLASRWHGMFHVKQSVTSSDSIILVATGVSPRCSALP